MRDYFSELSQSTKSIPEEYAKPQWEKLQEEERRASASSRCVLSCAGRVEKGLVLRYSLRCVFSCAGRVGKGLVLRYSQRCVFLFSCAGRVGKGLVLRYSRRCVCVFSCAGRVGKGQA